MLQWLKRKLCRWFFGKAVEEFMIIHIKTITEMQKDIEDLQSNQMALVALFNEIKKHSPPPGWVTICQNAIVGLDGRINSHEEALQAHQGALESFQKDRLEIINLSESDNN